MTSTLPTPVAQAGYVAGVWDLDPSHSDVSFTVRHMMVSKVRGRFTRFSGEIVTAENPLDSTVTAEIELESLDTANEQRDAHIRSADFFDTDTHKTMTFRSTGLRADGQDYLLTGDLTLKGVTRPVTLRLEANGVSADPWGGTRAGFSATGEINRKDFGVNWNAALDGGGVVVSDRIQIQIEAEAVLRSPAA